MKCRYFDSVSNTFVIVTASRNGVISLGRSLSLDPAITSFHACMVRDEDGSFLWHQLWSRSENDWRPRMSLGLNFVYATLSKLDQRLIYLVAEFFWEEYSLALSELSDLFNDSSSERETQARLNDEDFAHLNTMGRFKP